MAMSMLSLSLMLMCAAKYVDGSAWPVPYVMNTNTLPNLEVNLASPQDPFPLQEKAARSQEFREEEAQVARMKELRRGSRKVLLDARAKAARIIGRAMRTVKGTSLAKSWPLHAQRTAFYETQLEAGSGSAIALRIDVEPAGVPNATWSNEIESIGRQTVMRVHRSRDKDVLNMQDLSAAVLNELTVQLQDQIETLNGNSNAPNKIVNFSREPAGFAAIFGEENVHVQAAGNDFPNVASVVQAMEARTAITERLGHWTALTMDKELLQAELRMIKEMLDNAVARAAAVTLAIASA